MIKRIKTENGFSYLSEDGVIITLPSHLSELRIPPAWTEVEMNPFPEEKIYVTGFDKKGRKQYLYNPEFLKKRNLKKFSRLRHFVTSLPSLRRKVKEFIGLNRWTKEKTLAISIRLLDELSIRVGNECYKKENGSYGLTTLEKRHFVCKKGEYYLKFRGKSGKDHELKLENKDLCKQLQRLKALPGLNLLQYKTANGEIKPLRPLDINNFLKDISGGKITAKDFRTWRGTVMAIEQAGGEIEELKKSRKKKLVTQVVNNVSKALGNTLAICRSYYIHPVVMQSLEDETLPDKIKRLRNRSKRTPAMFSIHEYLTARLLFRFT